MTHYSSKTSLGFKRIFSSFARTAKKILVCIIFFTSESILFEKKMWISETWMRRTGLNEFQFDRNQVWYLNMAICCVFFFFLECFCYAITILNKITYIVSILKMMRSQVFPLPVTAHALFFPFNSVSWHLEKFIFKPNNTTPREKPLEQLILNGLHTSQVIVLTFYSYEMLKSKRVSQSVFAILWTSEPTILNKLARSF